MAAPPRRGRLSLDTAVVAGTVLLPLLLACACWHGRTRPVGRVFLRGEQPVVSPADRCSPREALAALSQGRWEERLPCQAEAVAACDGDFTHRWVWDSPAVCGQAVHRFSAPELRRLLNGTTWALAGDSHLRWLTRALVSAVNGGCTAGTSAGAGSVQPCSRACACGQAAPPPSAAQPLPLLGGDAGSEPLDTWKHRDKAFDLSWPGSKGERRLRMRVRNFWRPFPAELAQLVEERWR